MATYVIIWLVLTVILIVLGLYCEWPHLDFVSTMIYVIVITFLTATLVFGFKATIEAKDTINHISVYKDGELVDQTYAKGKVTVEDDYIMYRDREGGSHTLYYGDDYIIKIDEVKEE